MLSVALILRVAFVIAAWSATGNSVAFAPDTAGYLLLANELLQHGTFTVHGEPEVMRTPGYPVMLIPGVAAGQVQGVTTAIHIALSLLTTMAVYAIGTTLGFSRRAGFAAAMLYAIEPASITYTAYILTETAGTTLVACAIWLMVLYTRSGRLWQIIAGIALLAIGAYVRPILLFLPACAVAFFIIRGLWTRNRRELGYATIAGIAAVALLMPWSLRNRQYGYTGFSTTPAVTVYFYAAAPILAAQAGISHAEQMLKMGWSGDINWVDEQRWVQMHPEQRTWSDAQRHLYMQREGTRVVKENIGKYVRLHTIGVLRTLLGTAAAETGALFAVTPPTTTFAARVRSGNISFSDAVRLGVAAFLLAMYALAAYRLFRGRWSAALLIVVCTLAYIIGWGGGNGDSRFRVPAMPMVCALAGAGWAMLRERKNESALTAQPEAST